jgi:flagellar P-ring protein precursor FlgI
MDGKFTLVLNESHADFQVANDIAELIDNQLSFAAADGRRLKSGDRRLARAIDAVNIEVMIPPEYFDDTVAWVSQVLSLTIAEPQTASRVVINERAGTVVISGDVEISAVVVTQKNLVIEAGQPTSTNRFVGVESAAKPTAKLKSLVEALDALKVPVEDKIAIIKDIERAGKLHGMLVIE